jgi:hypothetical protein
VSESLRLEKSPNREYCWSLDTSYHELSTASCLSVPEKASWMPGLQSTCPPLPLQLDVLIAQLPSTHAKPADCPEHLPHPLVFQYRFWSLPFWNSRTWKRGQNRIRFVGS